MALLSRVQKLRLWGQAQAGPPRPCPTWSLGVLAPADAAERGRRRWLSSADPGVRDVQMCDG